MTYTNEQLALKLAVEGRPTNTAITAQAQLADAERYLKWLRANRGL